MISPRLYESTLLPHERRLADQLRPFGIHHCGNNLQLFTDAYAELEPAFCDVGWGSDVERVSATLPETFLNLRLDPVRMLQRSRDEIRADAESLLEAARSKAGLCCINMDHGTPDENVMAMFECAAKC